MITLIKTSLLIPHPDNPRKNIDTSSEAFKELVESIKVNGVMQNLTVVKFGSKLPRYKIIIGHRRYTAAKEAGLEELPCAIIEATDKEQMAIMLLENMQRVDLTPVEQAAGFQMMIDLGETITTISQKTGMSETTVRHRVKLAQLPQDEVQKAQERGATLLDFIELEKVKDEKEKQKLLEQAGTNNFEWSLRQAISREKIKEAKDTIIAMLKEDLAEEIPKAYDKKVIKTISLYGDMAKNDKWKEIVENIILNEKGYLYYISGNSWITIYKDKSDIEHEDENLTEEEKMEKRRAEREAETKIKLEELYIAEAEENARKLQELKKQAENKRMNFIKELKYARCLKNAASIMQNLMTMDSLELHFDYGQTENHIYEELEQAKIKEPIKAFLYYVAEFINEFEFIIQRNIYSSNKYRDEKDKRNSYRGIRDEFERSENVINHYELLELLGYQVADEERQLIEGTHPLYFDEDEMELEDLEETEDLEEIEDLVFMEELEEE